MSELNEYATHCKMNKTLVIDKFHTKYILNSNILAKSDMVEELCDEFVIENIYCGQVSQARYYDYEVAKQNIDISSNDVIYGALRIVGKGLIYVAKMNNKGELVLI